MNGGANLKILAVGDVCSEGGTEFLLKTLPKIKKEYGIDFTVVNGENSSASNAISADSAALIYAAGADVITGGNHTLHRTDLRPLLDSDDTLLRPTICLRPNMERVTAFTIWVIPVSRL